MARKKTSKSNKKNIKNQNVSTSLSFEINCIIFICISILIIISIYFNGGGFIGSFFANILKGLFGIGAYLLPVIIISSCIFIFFSKTKKINFFKLAMIFTIVLLIMNILHILTKDTSAYENYGQYILNIYNSGSFTNGGIIGALVGDLLTKIMGRVFTYVLSLFLIVVLVILLSEKSFFKMLERGFKRLNSYFTYDYNFEEEYDEVDQNYNNNQNSINFNNLLIGLKKVKNLFNKDESKKNNKPKENIQNDNKKTKILEPIDKLEVLEPLQELNEIDYAKNKIVLDKKVAIKYEDYILDNKDKYKKIKKATIINIKNENKELEEPKILLALDEINKSKSKSKNINSEIPLFFKQDIKNESMFNVKYKKYDNDNTYNIQDKVNSEIKEYTENQDIHIENHINKEVKEEITIKNSFNLDAYVNWKIDNTNENVIDYDIPTHKEIEELFSKPPEYFLNEDTDLTHLDSLSKFYNFDDKIEYTKDSSEESVKELERFNYTQDLIQPKIKSDKIIEEDTIKTSKLENVKEEIKKDEEEINNENNFEPYIEKAEKQKILTDSQISNNDKILDYKFPKLEFLQKNDILDDENNDIELRENSMLLIKTLKSFNINSDVIKISKGPVVTRYELSIEDGIKVSKILSLDANIALSLAATSIRIEAPIPGKSAVGIEVPNKEIKSVLLSEVICSEKFQKFESKVAFGLGKDITGNVIVTDISKMPHMLIAGATGSGKSVCINTLITSILYKASPDEVKLIMIDPKVVELSVYNGIPHLLLPVVTEPEKAAGTLNWAVQEMMDRYKLFAEEGVRNLEGYNRIMTQNNKPRLPQIVIIIDELADLMMTAAKEVENAICRMAQLARAAGVHLIIATQRPSVDVITGLIKSNIPSRIAFAVSSGTDSRTILDSVGAEKLLGKGDMLFKSVDMNKPLRIQGAFISDKEVENIVKYIKDNSQPNYDKSIIEKIESSCKSSDSIQGDLTDELTEDVIAFLVRKGKASTSLIQRQFRIGYNRAARIIEELEDRGIISGENGSKQREVLMDKYQFEEYMTRNSDY